jgi:dGTPase
LTDRAGRAVGPHAGRTLPAVITAYDASHPLELWSQASAEAQAAAIADDIAYNAHDIDDGLRAGIITLDALEEVPFLATLLGEIRSVYPSLGRSRTTHELQRRIITFLVEDVIAEGERRVAAFGIQTPEDVRHASDQTIGFSQETRKAERAIRDFLFKSLYRNARIMRVMADAEQMVEAMHAAFMATPVLLPDQWRNQVEAMDRHARALCIGDFIAGMTDRYAIETHRRLHGTSV